MRGGAGCHDQIAIAKVIISTKEYLACVMPYEKALVLGLLKYDKEIKKLSEFDLPVKEASAYKVSKKEIEIAKELIKSMSSKWNPKKYVDEYQQAIHKWVEESVHKLPHTTMKQRGPAKSDVVNFVQLLKMSLASSGKSAHKIKNAKTYKLVKHKTRHAKHATRH